MIDLLRNGDMAVAIHTRELDEESIQIGVLFLEVNTRSPLQLGEYLIELPRDLIDQPVPRVAVEMSFKLKVTT